MNLPKANIHCKANVQKNFGMCGNLAVLNRSQAERGIAPQSIQPSVRPLFLGDLKCLACNALPGPAAAICRQVLGC
jgi:hypothetical protein